MDFRRAYDTVPRAQLWEKLAALSVGPWMLRAVQALYADVSMCVRGPGGCTGTFPSVIGLKQGCPLSPALFGLCVDDFERSVLEQAELAATCETSHAAGASRVK